MLTRWSPYLRILLGVLLLSAPALWNPGADYATVTYDAQNVEYANGYLRVGALSGQIDGLACYALDESRYCALERYVAEHGPVTVPRTDLAAARSEFVVAGGFYRPVYNASDDSATLGLKAVSSETVLSELSEPAAELPAAAREAVRTGDSVTVRTSVERLDGDDRRSSFVAANGTYYLLERNYTAHDGTASPLVTPVKVLLFALGLRLVLRGQADRQRLDDPPL